MENLCEKFLIVFRASQEKMEVLDQEDCREKRSVYNSLYYEFNCVFIFSFMTDHIYVAYIYVMNSNCCRDHGERGEKLVPPALPDPPEKV